MSAQHTAGPWKTRSMGPWQTDSELGSHSSWAIGTDSGVVAIAVTHEHYDDPEYTANARLIAAAPDLLAVVQMVADASELSGLTGPIGHAARAALYRALGEGERS